MKKQERPNILFIMTDEQRYDTFTHVNPHIKTPYMDKLIKDSVFFQNAYCSNPSCIPSRAAIVTGKHPTECKTPTYITYLPAYEKTFMSRLQALGYYTAVVGKQHFAESSIEKGYDEAMIMDGHSPMGHKEELTLYYDYLAQHNVDKDTLYEGGLMIGGSWKGDIKYHIDSFVGDLGQDWLKHKRPDKPWFLTISFPGPHQPYDCEGTAFAEQYDLDAIPMPETCYEDLDSKPPHYKQMKEKAYVKNHSEEVFKKTKRSYYANVSLIDQKVGEIIETLKEDGLYDNTLIIYTSDHGDFMGDFGIVSKAQYLSECLMRVPLFVKPPIKNFKGFDVDDYVLNIDIAATCLEAAGGEVDKGMSNYAYTDYWRNKDAVKTREYLYLEASGMKACIKDGYKLVHYLDKPYGEFYDLNHDPMEKVNLWEDEAYNGQKLIHNRLLIDHLVKMTPLWDMKWNHQAPAI